MSQAITHFLVPALIVAVIRDYYLKKKDKKHFPLHYVFIAGLAGVLPDIDLIVYAGLYHFGFTIDQIHRAFTHSLLFVSIFLVLGLLTLSIKSKQLGKHKMNLSVIFFIIAFGVFTHIFLDSIFIGDNIKLFYPFSSYSIGLDLVNSLPQAIQGMAPAMLDGLFFIIWMLYLEYKHKLSDLI